MIGGLPKSLIVAGTEYGIRTDYRVILDILEAFGDPDLEAKEKIYVCLYILYEDFELIPPEQYEEAYKAAIDFIDAGQKKDDKRPHPRTMDWEQDAPIIFPAINSIAHTEVRSISYLHWWTFLGYFMEIREGIFAQVLGLRQKRAKGKKLEKCESEFWRSNRDICELKKKVSSEERAIKEELNALLG